MMPLESFAPVRQIELDLAPETHPTFPIATELIDTSQRFMAQNQMVLNEADESRVTYASQLGKFYLRCTPCVVIVPSHLLKEARLKSILLTGTEDFEQIREHLAKSMLRFDEELSAHVALSSLVREQLIQDYEAHL